MSRVAAALVATILLASAIPLESQGGRQVKVVLFNEAVTEVIVPNGRAMRIGSATRSINQATRRILGYREQQASSESSFILTATVQ